MSDVTFPKKSHHGYFDRGLQTHFNSKSEKRVFFKEHGLVEKSPASKAHIKRVKDFVAWSKNETRKNPNFENTKEFKSAKYPDGTH